MASPHQIITNSTTSALPRDQASISPSPLLRLLCSVFSSRVPSFGLSNYCNHLLLHARVSISRIGADVRRSFVVSLRWSISVRVFRRFCNRRSNGSFLHFLKDISVTMTSGRKIMVAVDDSEVSAYAFTWALHNLVRKTDHVVALTAAPFVDITYPSTDMAAEYGPTVIPSAVDTENNARNVNTDAKELIARCISQCNQADIPCTGEVVKGDAGTWIVDEANRLDADVIVVGSRGNGVLKRAFMGSNSDYVLHNATCPVAIVRHIEEDLKKHDPLNSAGGSRKIVIAVDQSREAVYAFKWALENFVNDEDKVILYHVNQSVPPVTTAGTGEFGIEEVYVPSESLGKTEVEALDESEKLVEKYMEYAARETKIKCEGVVVTGQPEVKVIEGLVNLQADAVIIGTHDRSAISRTLLSSITDYLAHNSPCPLLVARMPKVSGESPGTESAPEHKRAT